MKARRLLVSVAFMGMMAVQPAFAACGDKTEGEVPGLDLVSGTIRLGSIQPLTGRATLVGIGVAQGIDAAVEAINAAGGIDGCKLELIVVDDQLTLDLTVMRARRLVDEEQVWAIVAPTGSANLSATYSLMEESGTIMWAPISPSDQGIREIYLLSPSRVEQGRVCMDYLVKSGGKNIGVLTQRNDIGVQIEEAATTQSAILQVPIVASEKVDPVTPSLATPIINLVNNGADSLLVALDAGSLSIALNLLHDQGFKGPICSDGLAAGVGGLSNVGAASPEASDGFVAALPTALPDAEDPAVDRWRESIASYQGQFKDAAPGFSLQGYSYMMALAEVIDRLDGDLSRDHFHAVAEGLESDPILLGSIPEIACGPLPEGHTCARGAGLAEFDSAAKTWVQLSGFEKPASE